LIDDVGPHRGTFRQKRLAVFPDERAEAPGSSWPLGLHVLRHTHATLALTSGVPVHVVAARIGDRPESVLATYAHLLPTSDAEAAEQVAALLPR
jgi:integrase